MGLAAGDMTHEADREDLARHAEEIERHETFNYAVLDEGETELLGCVYIDPPDDERRPAPTPSSHGGSSTRPSAPTSSGRSTSFVPALADSAWGFQSVDYSP